MTLDELVVSSTKGIRMLPDKTTHTDVYLPSINDVRSYRGMDKVQPAVMRPGPAGDMLYDSGSVDLRVESPDNAEITTKIIFPKFNAETNERMNVFDDAVHAAVVSLIIRDLADGKTDGLLSLNRLVRKVYEDHNKKNTKKQREEVLESLRRLGSIRLQIQWKDEAKAKKIRYKKAEGSLISWELVELAVPSGDETQFIKLLAMPPLFIYAERTGQLEIIDNRYLGTMLRQTRRDVILRTYLLDRILTMYRNKKMHTTILLSTIYDNVIGSIFPDTTPAGISAGQDRALKGRIGAILNTWTASGLIKSYTKDKPLSKYIIQLNPQISANHDRLRAFDIHSGKYITKGRGNNTTLGGVIR